MGSNQTTVSTTALSGAVALIVVYVIGLLGVDLPPEVGAAITALIAAFVGYFVPASSGA